MSTELTFSNDGGSETWDGGIYGSRIRGLMVEIGDLTGGMHGKAVGVLDGVGADVESDDLKSGPVYRVAELFDLEEFPNIELIAEQIALQIRRAQSKEGQYERIPVNLDYVFSTIENRSDGLKWVFDTLYHYLGERAVQAVRDIADLVMVEYERLAAVEGGNIKAGLKAFADLTRSEHVNDDPEDEVPGVSHPVLEILSALETEGNVGGHHLRKFGRDLVRQLVGVQFDEGDIRSNYLGEGVVDTGDDDVYKRFVRLHRIGPKNVNTLIFSRSDFEHAGEFDDLQEVLQGEGLVRFGNVVSELVNDICDLVPGQYNRRLGRTGIDAYLRGADLLAKLQKRDFGSDYVFYQASKLADSLGVEDPRTRDALTDFTGRMVVSLLEDSVGDILPYEPDDAVDWERIADEAGRTHSLKNDIPDVDDVDEEFPASSGPGPDDVGDSFVSVDDVDEAFPASSGLDFLDSDKRGFNPRERLMTD